MLVPLCAEVIDSISKPKMRPPQDVNYVIKTPRNRSYSSPARRSLCNSYIISSEGVLTLAQIGSSLLKAHTGSLVKGSYRILLKGLLNCLAELHSPGTERAAWPASRVHLPKWRGNGSFPKGFKDYYSTYMAPKS